MRLVFFVICLSVLLRAQSNPLAGDSAAIDIGKGNFRLYCSPCHGIRAQGGRGPDLTRGSFAAGDSDADLFRVIAKGVPGTEMSGYSDRFDDQMIWRFVAYIRSAARVNTSAVSGDVQHGLLIFEGKGHCRNCHATTDKGSGIGPPLTRIGRQRSVDFLREKLVDPDASITPGYTTIQVTLRDGQTVSGIEKGFDDFSAQLVDVSGHFHSYRRDEVNSMQRQNKSLMPAYGKELSPTEQTDLIAYLSSLRGEK